MGMARRLTSALRSRWTISVRTFKSAQSEDASPTLRFRNDPYMNADLLLAKSLLLAHGFDQAAVAALFEYSGKSDTRGFKYPWEDLEKRLHEPAAERIYLVGYGSLLNPQSAARSVRNTPSDGHRPVVAMGARRVFNYRMPDGIFERYGIEPGARDRAALNAEPAAASVLNGRLIELARSDLPNLRVREAAYDLESVTCLFWDKPNTAPFTAFVFCCNYEFWEGKRYVDNTLTPFKPYYRLCRAGAEMISPGFLSFYLKTCFLADRSTTAFDLEASAEWRGTS